MLKYIGALLVFLAIGGLGAALPVCTDCYANIVTQTDHQEIANVAIGNADLYSDPLLGETVAIGNEGLTAGIIVVPKPNIIGPLFATAGFARIDQSMDQEVSNLGGSDPEYGAKGITWNKAIQAAWVVNQGLKEVEVVNGEPIGIAKEGAYAGQGTVQTITNVPDYNYRDGVKILNVDNKLAMIADNVSQIVDLAARASSDTSDDQSSSGSISNYVNITIAGKDPM